MNLEELKTRRARARGEYLAACRAKLGAAERGRAWRAFLKADAAYCEARRASGAPSAMQTNVET